MFAAEVNLQEYLLIYVENKQKRTTDLFQIVNQALSSVVPFPMCSRITYFHTNLKSLSAIKDHQTPRSGPSKYTKE